MTQVSTTTTLAFLGTATFLGLVVHWSLAAVLAILACTTVASLGVRTRP
ncbi:hypothetical protein [Actinokineospora terrae]|uniref:Uncharacterized protein n=1 Tax=Actinokineospora terrae TaxID=155974 RepID=A0A1H9R081_9PSEU|nr:hypothetical protein [Actinokineospora terrae]SER65479.1 hypothetical protein SAMN04487818_104493 [Actinokineospora terrae]